MTTPEFTKTIARVAQVRKTMRPLETKLDSYKAELDQLKYDIITHMQATKSKRTEPVNGYYVTRVAGRSKPVIINEQAAYDWLDSNGYDLSDYARLDATKIQSTLKDDGEVVNFIEIETGQEYLSIKEEG